MPDSSMGYVSLGVGWMHEVKRAEKQAHELMDAFDFRWGERDEETWIRTFGDTEQELKEQEDVLARRVASIPFWRRRERRAAVRAYIYVHALLTAAYGLESVWR